MAKAGPAIAAFVAILFGFSIVYNLADWPALVSRGLGGSAGAQRSQRSRNARRTVPGALMFTVSMVYREPPETVYKVVVDGGSWVHWKGKLRSVTGAIDVPLVTGDVVEEELLVGDAVCRRVWEVKTVKRDYWILSMEGMLGDCNSRSYPARLEFRVEVARNRTRLSIEATIMGAASLSPAQQKTTQRTLARELRTWLQGIREHLEFNRA